MTTPDFESSQSNDSDAVAFQNATRSKSSADSNKLSSSRFVAVDEDMLSDIKLPSLNVYSRNGSKAPASELLPSADLDSQVAAQVRPRTQVEKPTFTSILIDLIVALVGVALLIFGVTIGLTSTIKWFQLTDLQNGGVGSAATVAAKGETTRHFILHAYTVTYQYDVQGTQTYQAVVTQNTYNKLERGVPVGIIYARGNPSLSRLRIDDEDVTATFLDMILYDLCAVIGIIIVMRTTANLTHRVQTLFKRG